MRVVVIGAGTGGLTAALTFRRFGIDTLLFEKAPALQEIGAGIMLSPNATRILNRLGLEEALRAVGVRPKTRRSYRWADGRILSITPLTDVSDRTFGAPYYNLYRTELLDVLTKALAEGILYLNHWCVGLAQHSDRVEIRFQNGSSPTLTFWWAPTASTPSLLARSVARRRRVFPTTFPIARWFPALTSKISASIWISATGKAPVDI